MFSFLFYHLQELLLVLICPKPNIMHFAKQLKCNCPLPFKHAVSWASNSTFDVIKCQNSWQENVAIKLTKKQLISKCCYGLDRKQLIRDCCYDFDRKQLIKEYCDGLDRKQLIRECCYGLDRKQLIRECCYYTNSADTYLSSPIISITTFVTFS